MNKTVVAYYPGETPLFEGDITLTEISRSDTEGPTAQVSVAGEPSLEFEILSKIEHPIRTIHEGYFLRSGESIVRICNVDLELEEQPSLEIVARVILAEQLATV